MSRSLFAMVWSSLLLGACQPADCPDGFLRDNDGNCIETGGGSTDGPPENVPAPKVTNYQAECIDDDTFVASIDTNAETSGTAIMDIWELDVSGDPEEYEMDVTVSSRSGDHLELEITGSETQWSCNIAHGEFDRGNPSNPDLTFAIRVYDANGEFSDCVRFGHLRDCMVDGDCPHGIDAPTRPEELDACEFRGNIL